LSPAPFSFFFFFFFFFKRFTPGKRANEKNPEETRRDKEGKKQSNGR